MRLEKTTSFSPCSPAQCTGMIQARMQRQLGCASLPGGLVLQQGTARAVATAVVAAGLEGTGRSDGVVPGLGAAPIPQRHWSSQLRPLSANQQQMWLLHNMGLAAAYNMQVGWAQSSVRSLPCLQGLEGLTCTSSLCLSVG